MVTLADVKCNKEVKTLIEKSDAALCALEYTEHSYPHLVHVSDVAKYVLTALDYSSREIELAAIAGYLHDIGNVVNRNDHAQSGAVMAYRILDKMGMDMEDIMDIISAIGNHDETTAVPISAIAAALIIADKSDVRRSRVRSTIIEPDRIHDRVNYSVIKSEVKINDSKDILLELQIDTRYGSVIDYFEIFLERMLLCKKAAQKLGRNFQLMINKQNFF